MPAASELRKNSSCLLEERNGSSPQDCALGSPLRSVAGEDDFSGIHYVADISLLFGEILTLSFRLGFISCFCDSTTRSGQSFARISNNNISGSDNKIVETLMNYPFYPKCVDA